MIRVSKADNVARKAIFLEGGLHARYEKTASQMVISDARYEKNCISDGCYKCMNGWIYPGEMR